MGITETRLLTVDEVAKLFRVTPQTLWHWRRAGIGPRWARVGARIRYRQDDIEDYVAGGRGETADAS